MISQIKNSLRNNYKKFKASKEYQALKSIPIIRKAKLSTSQLLWKLFPAKYQLHDDPILQEVFQLVGKEAQVSSIVETGTYLGSSTSFMAEKFPSLKIHTCEIESKNYKKAKTNLKKFPNVKIYKGHSPKFLEYLIERNLLGEKPLFFLDAHWWDNWPLEEEIKIITHNLKSAVIIIDDFKVPDKKQFKFDFYGEKECSLDLIKPKMNKKNKYNLLFPDYSAEDFPKGKFYPELSGYPIIFQNMQKEFRSFSEKKLVTRFFSDRTDLIKTSF